MSTATSTDVATDVCIRFEGVHKSLGGRKVLDGLDLVVPRGETLAIMGPSGTGKSVLLRHAIGLLHPDRGRVEVEGKDVARMRGDELAAYRRRAGYLFQDGALINWLSVGDNVALALRESGVDEDEVRERVESRLERVGLVDVWEKMPSEISGGMRKRVALARALVTGPEIIYYDEPNAGLDPAISMSINHLIRELADDLGITSIVVTHLLSCVRVVAHRVVLLLGGTVAYESDAERFLSGEDPRVREFLGSDPD